MIRAKMSDTRHASEKVVHMLGQALPELGRALPAMAVQEARAILAETEDEDTISYSWAGIGTGRGPAAKMHDGFQHSPWVSLAESLAAFVQS